MTGDSNRHFGGRVWWFGKARTEVEQHTQVVVQMIRWYLGDNLDRALKIIIQKGEEAMFRWKRKQERGATREKELEERYFNLWRGTCLTFKSIFYLIYKSILFHYRERERRHSATLQMPATETGLRFWSILWRPSWPVQLDVQADQCFLHTAWSLESLFTWAENSLKNAPHDKITRIKIIQEHKCPQRATAPHFSQKI